jgi:hypothetical protein
LFIIGELRFVHFAHLTNSQLPTTTTHSVTALNPSKPIIKRTKVKFTPLPKQCKSTSAKAVIAEGQRHKSIAEAASAHHISKHVVKQNIATLRTWWFEADPADPTEPHVKPPLTALNHYLDQCLSATESLRSNPERQDQLSEKNNLSQTARDVGFRTYVRAVPGHV